MLILFSLIFTDIFSVVVSQDAYHFQLWPHPSWYHTKFRPHTESFLERIAQLYELHICTFGTRTYAHAIARYLDPDGRYFSQRILSRDECFHPTLKTSNLKWVDRCLPHAAGDNWRGLIYHPCNEVVLFSVVSVCGHAYGPWMVVKCVICWCSMQCVSHVRWSGDQDPLLYCTVVFVMSHVK